MRFLMLGLSLFLPFSVVAEDVMRLQWIDLVPIEDRNSHVMMTNRNIEHIGLGNAPQPDFGFVRPDLHNRKVQLSGYIIPLEGDFYEMREFLLVPFVGACIHVPPPPLNQIVHVIMNYPIPTESLWAHVKVKGTLTTERLATEMMTVGYTLHGNTFRVGY